MFAAISAILLSVILISPVQLAVVSAPNPRLSIRFLWCEMDKTQWVKQFRFKRAPSKAQIGALKRLFRRARASEFLFNLQFAMGDAAQTAMFHGTLCMAMAAIYKYVQKCQPAIALQPEYTDSIHFEWDISIRMQAPIWAVAMFIINLYILNYQREQSLCTIKTS